MIHGEKRDEPKHLLDMQRAHVPRERGGTCWALRATAHRRLG